MNYLGVISQVITNQEATTKNVCQLVDITSSQLTSIYLNHYYAHMFYQCTVNLNFTYSLVAISIYDNQIDRIHKNSTEK